MTWLMSLAAGAWAKGWVQRVGVVLTCLALVLALYGVLRGGWAVFDWLNDRQAASRALDKRSADNARIVVKADREAGAGKAARDSANRNEMEAERERIDNASDRGCDALDGLFGLCP